MEIRIALAGNPNCGKTTLFNALTGSNQFVGNWPGVTVEKKEGTIKKYGNVKVTDLPGIYSLSPYTPEELIARNYLMGERPDVILNVVDGTNLERNLYLTTQLTELGIPVVMAVNMMDVVRKNKDSIHLEKLSKELGIRVVEICALKGEGVLEAAEAAVEAAQHDKTVPRHTFSGPAEHALAHIEEAAVHSFPEENQRWYAIKIFERDEKVLGQLQLSADVLAHIEEDIQAAEKELDDDAESIITNERYQYISALTGRCCQKHNAAAKTVSDRIDGIVTSRWLGLPIFALVMFLVYWISMGPLGSMLTDWANDGVFGEGWDLLGIRVPGIPVILEAALEKLGTAEWLTGLILDGITAGVGAVLGFVPQLLVLFFLLAFLEACGYMARIAFVLDRIFRKFGLSGKSFIPMLIGTGCGVPGIMASRTIENERDRRMTIMTTTFIPCGAKIPFISMLAGALYNGSPLVSASAYFAGMTAIILSGIMLKKTGPFMGEPAPFIMELPAYHLPTPKNLFRAAWERGWSFIKKAGTIILLSAMVIWFVTYFGFTDGSFGMLDESELSNSLLAAAGKAAAWIFAPLGWGTWQAAVASVTGLVAKENIVGTMGILYGASGNLQGALREAFPGVSGYSFLVFNLLCAPCFAAIGAIRREMNSGSWTWFAIAYQCGFAYGAALMVQQFGSFFAGNGNLPGLTAAIAVLVLFLYLLLRPCPKTMNSD